MQFLGKCHCRTKSPLVSHLETFGEGVLYVIFLRTEISEFSHKTVNGAEIPIIRGRVGK
jgi:hypothetical protein